MIELDKQAQTELYHMIMQVTSEDGKDLAEQIVGEILQTGHSPTLDKITAPIGYEKEPVTMKVFLEDPYYLGDVENLRGILKDDLEALFDDGDYVEGVIDGAIGWGKSVFVSICFAYMLYRLSCLQNPQAYYGMMPGSKIYLVNQSVNKTLAKKVVFGEVKARIDASPYFKEQFQYDEFIFAELRFPKDIEVLPLASMDTSALGLNIFGGCIDEINFMPIIKGSTRVRSASELYDTPQRLYESISRRIKSRFLMAGGYIPGKILAISSSQYPDDFTAKKKIESRTDDKIFARTHTLWEAKAHVFGGETFRVEIGGLYGRSRILTGDEEKDEIEGEVVDVPVEFRSDFDKDLDAAIRDIAGRPTSTLNPFITDFDKVHICIDPMREHPFTNTETTLTDGVRLMPERIAEFDKKENKWHPKYFVKAWRYAHIDYALTNDECGLAIGCIGSMIPIDRRNMEGELYEEQVPYIHIDLMLRIVPPLGGEIDLENVRGIIYGLQKYGFRMKQVTFDSYQSAEGQQEMRKRGIESHTLSIDGDMTPYLEMKSAIIERRLGLYQYKPFMDEAVRLELDRTKGKVDHPPNSDKGVTDAVAGVVAQCVDDKFGVVQVAPLQMW